MRILLTGATGYIGKRLLVKLLKKNHEVYCCVRDKSRFNYPDEFKSQIKIIEIDFLNNAIPQIEHEIDIAYYLIHSMTAAIDKFIDLEEKSARNFVSFMKASNVKQVIYLSGIVNDNKLSKHLESRRNVENILAEGNFKLTTLRAGIVIGSGSASFEILRDLVEKLPIMITPKWVLTNSQPIAVRNILQYLVGVINNEKCFNKSFDVGGPDILSYKQMLLQYAEVRELKRWIISVPIMTPRLSSYWLYFVTATSYKLAVNLVNSLKIEVICKDDEIKEIFDYQLLNYKEAVEAAMKIVQSNKVISSWKDAMNVDKFDLSSNIQVPSYGVFNDEQKFAIIGDTNKVLEKIWSVGGKNGWYYANWLWRTRGFLDKLVGGVGLRRGRTNVNNIYAGDALDFWRVLLAEKNEKRLLLFAEMKLPGEAWLEFKITQEDKFDYIIQKAVFRPKGLWGRIYWFLLKPFHIFIFKGMAKRISQT